MKLAVGQVWQHRETREQVVVLAVRDERHPRGLGYPYGDSALAYPISDLAPPFVDPATLHIFDSTILCDAIASHSDLRWQFVDAVHYKWEAGDSILYAHSGPHPVRGDA